MSIFVPIPSGYTHSDIQTLLTWAQEASVLLNQPAYAGLIYPPKFTTVLAPAYIKGALYYDTTLNKLRIGGATAWETVTSS